MIKMENIEKLKLVMWDLDGTILDSRKQHFEASQRVLKDHGIELSKDYAKKYFGQTAAHIFGEIAGNLVSAEELKQIIEERDICLPTADFEGSGILARRPAMVGKIP